MAYQTGTPASPVDLLQQMNTFLAANGWTSDKNAADGSGWESHLHNGAVYAHLCATVGAAAFVTQAFSGYALFLYLSDGFNGSQPWNLQPTNPPFANGTTNAVGVGMNLSAGPFSAYYFFTDASNANFVCVLEKTPGVYEFLAWGTSLKKCGTWTGGAYFLGSSGGDYAANPSPSANTPGYNATSHCPGCHDGDPNGPAAAFVRCDSDSFVGKWIPISDTGDPNNGYTGRNGSSSVAGPNVPPATSIARYALGSYVSSAVPQPFQWMQTSALDGRVNLLPVLWWVGRDGSTADAGGFSLIGSLPTIFFSNGVGNGFVPGAIYTIGPDDYMMFPNFAVLQVS
jgi:hypothetical protein